MQHCQMIQAGEIQAIVGDCSRNGIGGPQYCGLWSLTSIGRAFNAFGNSYAGLLPGLIRGRTPRLEIVDDATCALVQEATDEAPFDVRAEYTLSASTIRLRSPTTPTCAAPDATSAKCHGAAT